MFLPDYKLGDEIYKTLEPVSSSQADLQWSQSTVLIVLGLPVISITIVLTCIGFIKRSAQYIFGERPKATTQTMRKSIISTTESTVETSHSLKLQGFRDHFQRLSSDSYCNLADEFEKLKLNETLTSIAADDPVNRLKNRFVNILAYDHSRFMLPLIDEVEGSDYINANYISGFHSSKEFIATQGPLKSTCDDFWRMCWEAESKAIVMLTKCIDKDREKCYRYWPIGSMVEQYGDIEVEVLREKIDCYKFHEWIISEFRLKRDGTTRIIKHFQFLTWPDFGAVDPVEALISFLRTVREFVPHPRTPNQIEVLDRKEVPPIIVHCSAGVGRSGTLIAVDIAMQQIKFLKTVDIYGIVYTMRRERVWMVQTEQQYICVYKCVLSLLDETETSASSSCPPIPEIDESEEAV